jgi:pimeloyl-ACP methyl ester carboxylesterase
MTERSMAIFFDTAVQQGPNGVRSIAENTKAHFTSRGVTLVPYNDLLSTFVNKCLERVRRRSPPDPSSKNYSRWRQVGSEWHLFAGSIDLYKAIYTRRTALLAGLHNPQGRTIALLRLFEVARRYSNYDGSEVAEAKSFLDLLFAAYGTDPLNHHVVNTRWFTEATAAMERANAAAGNLTLPTLLVQAGDDKLVSAEASRAFAAAAPNCSYDEIAGAFHELWFEPDGASHAARFAAWFIEKTEG